MSIQLSDPTTPVCITVPAAPTITTVAVTDNNEITVVWIDNSTTETAQVIERSLDNVSWSVIDTIAADLEIYVDSGLASNTLYYYRIKATNASAYSAYSNVDSAETTITVDIESHRYLYWSGTYVTESDMRYLGLVDGVPEPVAIPGFTVVYIDELDGLLKAKDGDGNVTVLGVADTDTDELVKVSVNDTIAGYLNGKLVAGSGVSLTENNDGGNETLTIAATGPATDEKTKVSANDTTAGYLNGKLIAGSNVILTEGNDGGDETLTISANDTNDPTVKVSANDTTAGYLNGKLLAGTNITLTENGDGGNETLTIAASSGNDDINKHTDIFRLPDTLLASRISAGMLEKYSVIGETDVANPAIPTGAGGTSDDKIREIGNVLYEPDETERRYKTFYTGYNSGSETDEKIHYAYSPDGKTWTKSASNPVIASRQEDPYVVRHNGTYYMYNEDKANQGANGYIRRWSSTDCETWTDDGQLTGLGSDSASPTVWLEGSTWYMLYEQWPSTPLDIRLATSSDGLAWTPEATNPVFSAGDTSWAVDAVIPDDIIKLGDTYYLSFHGGPTGVDSNVGIAWSTDLLTWTDSGGYKTSDESVDVIKHAQFLYDNRLTFLYYILDTGGIFRGFPIDPTLTIVSGAVTVEGDYFLIAAESGTADDLVTINGGVFGQLLIIQADSGDTITVKHGTGNISLNGATDFSLSGDKTLMLYWDGAGWADVGAGGSNTTPHSNEILMDDDSPRSMIYDDDGDLLYEG